MDIHGNPIHIDILMDGIRRSIRRSVAQLKDCKVGPGSSCKRSYKPFKWSKNQWVSLGFITITLPIQGFLPPFITGFRGLLCRSSYTFCLSFAPPFFLRENALSQHLVWVIRHAQPGNLKKWRLGDFVQIIPQAPCMHGTFRYTFTMNLWQM